MSRIITISREFGSGGRELGRHLSEVLQIDYYDQEIVSEIAKRTDVAEDYVKQISESRPISLPVYGGRFNTTVDPLLDMSLSIHRQQHALLRELSEKSDCVIIGRCADYVLRVRRPFRIFVYAEMESRLKRCEERKPENENLSRRKMQQKIREIDRNRARYYAYFSKQKWSAPCNYDLMINTSSGIDLKKTAASVAAYMEQFYQ